MSAGTLDKMRRRSARWGDAVILLVVLLAAWQAIYWIAGAVALSPPLTAGVDAWELLISPDFWPNVGSTFAALAIALLIETGLGLLLGLACGLHKLTGEVIEPVLVSFYALPKIVFYPIILMFCGIGLWSEVVFGVLHGILPIALFSMAAVRGIAPVYLKTARVMGLTTGQAMIGIALPAALPEVFTGLRIGFSVTLVGVLFSEMFGSKRGLGFLLMNAIGLNKVAEITALTLLLAGFAVVVNSALLALDHRLHKRF